ncbi:GerAB/ArcD/ProY family transporter [Eubacterium multiforme]|uniref:Spore germination protein (Amino acid permease) n=1 Tax=Eubacterium multiforme TaxID=83339 RepID=A0ABT9UUT8_9FIRM|nr:GerAB/ArcD/ProY family transporter [Eubacterium multiforme]MDQ0150093.1 spore germination protein (amino acid permease) [Eubacterium multiforme]
MKKNLQISTSEFICMLIGYSIIITELKFPDIINTYAAQNGWITTALSGIYPILFFTMYGFVFKAYPDKNIFQINLELLGKILGTFFNIFFIIYLVAYSATHFSGFAMILVNTILWYYTTYQTLIIVIIVASIATFFRFKAQLKLGQFTLYVIIAICILLGFSLTKGNKLNIMPILSIAPKELFKAVYHGIYAYAGFEIMVLYLPYLKNKSDYKKIAITTTSVLILILTWLIFIAIFYFGPDALNLFYFPMLDIMASIKVPLINSFTLIFILCWSIHSLKNSTFSFSNILNILPPKKNTNYKKLWLVILIPFFYFISKLISNVINLVYFVNYIFIPMMILVLFNIFLLFISVIRRNKNDMENPS